MPNFLSRLFRPSPPDNPAEPTKTPADADESAVVARLRVQMEDLRTASQSLAEGKPDVFLAILPRLEHINLLDAQGQSFGHGYLLEAAGRGYVEVVQALAARGVAIAGTGLIRRNAGPGDTALHAAAGQGHREVARFLLDHGADVNAMNGWGETPLHCAAAQRRVEMVAYLLERGANIDARLAGSDIGTPLCRAAEKLFLDVVKYLLEHGADPRLTNDAKKQSPSVVAHRGFEAACRQFHRTQGEERARLGERIKQYEVLVQLLEGAERRFGPVASKEAE